MTSNSDDNTVSMTTYNQGLNLNNITQQYFDSSWNLKIPSNMNLAFNIASFL